ncbi:MAG: hypothetical protein ACRBCS_13875 [Cellvibrionaceae bacterium]
MISRHHKTRFNLIDRKTSLVTSLSLSLLSCSLLAGEIKPVDTSPFGEDPSGIYKVTVEHDSDLATHTIYRPTDLLSTTENNTYPVVVWGEGACEDAGLMFPEFLSEIASHGYIVIADGPPVRSKIRQPGQTQNTASNTDTATEKTETATPPRPRPTMSLKPDGTDLIAALDWIENKNQERGHRFYQRANMKKVAAMGMSCGGLMSYGASSDPRITTVGIWNSGLLKADEKIYKDLHSSIIIITGGESDIAYPNGQRDYEMLKDSKPIFYGYYPSVGHFGTYTEDNGGAFGNVAVSWLNWQLKDDLSKTGQQFLVGDNCPVCSNPQWITQSHHLK